MNKSGKNEILQNKDEKERQTFQRKIVLNYKKGEPKLSLSERKEENLVFIGKGNSSFMMGDNNVADQDASFTRSADSELSLNTSSPSQDEYDGKVSALIMKSGPGWGCTKCPYTARQKSHVSEHAERHITGFTIPCKFCGKIFGMKRNLRHHVRKCIRKMDISIPSI